MHRPRDPRDTACEVPRWAHLTAHAVPWVVLPSSIWRFPVAFGHEMGMIDPGAGPWVWWALPYTLALILVTEGLAYLTLGLVQGWGEVVPRWVPLLGGRRVRTWAAVVPATLGGLALTALWGESLLGMFYLWGATRTDFTNDGWLWLAIAAYAPLALWGPMLLAVTWAYAWRRRVR